VLVIAGPESPRTLYYEPTSAVPSAHLGHGGLGNFWHGVIPTGGRENFAGSQPTDFEQLCAWFYPGLEVAARLGKPFLFVPWKPIRPAKAWLRLGAERGGKLKLIRQTARRFELGNGVVVHTDAGTYRASRVWVCAGALQTPALLDRSLGRVVSRGMISDHVLCYLGQVDRKVNPEVAAPRLERTTHGVWFPAGYDAAGTALVTSRPARFEFRRLDFGIEQRAVFGLPPSTVLAKLLRGRSAGLIAEALYNRAGLFPGARMQSIYAQLVVRDAYEVQDGGESLVRRQDTIRSATDALRATFGLQGLQPSRRPDLGLPMIHLHHSVDARAAAAAGLNTTQSLVRVADASMYENIGPEHHSFKVMVGAFVMARAAQ